MYLVAVIPARFNSTRLPGKPLMKIAGKPLIQWVYQQVIQSPELKRVLVATDDERVKEMVESFGGEAVITSPAHDTGSDRIWEVIQKIPCDGVLNVQGDEPLISPRLVSRVAKSLAKNPEVVITAATQNTSYQDFQSPHQVKVVIDAQGGAVYFSRSAIPHATRDEFTFFYHHYGIYGYSRELLDFFAQIPPSRLERREKLEQLRFIEHQKPIRVLLTKEKSLGVDTLEDKVRVEKVIAQRFRL